MLLAKTIPFRRSIHAKMIVTVSTVILIICTFIYTVVPYLAEQEMIEVSLANTEGITDIAASSIAPGLFFEDNDAVSSTMSNVLVYNEAQRIILYDLHQKKFAELRKKSFHAPLENVPIDANNTSLLSDYIVSSKAVYNQGKMIGYLVVYTSLESVKNQVTQFRNAILLFSISAFVFGNVIMMIGLRPIIKRIQTIVKVVEKITNGNYSERASVNGNDEIRLLADSFNTMVDSLVQAYNRITYTNSNLELIVEQRTAALNEEIARRAKTENDLLTARDKAEEANRTKSAFLASMSHELRTPLNSIIGFSQVLREDDTLDQQSRTYIEMMYRSGSHLLDLINDILDISKIESGQLDLYEDMAFLADIIESVRTIVMTKASEKDLLLVVRVDSNCPLSVVTDARRLKQVLINLVGNAVKFTEQGSVQLLLELIHYNQQTSSATIRFIIKDTGPGISEDQIQRIFQPFKQQSTKYSEGTGLGLAISSRIVEKMGGKISVSSKVGYGSKFSFILDLKTHDLEDNFLEKFPIKRTIKSVLYDSQIPQVLIVDDVETNRFLLSALIEPIGFECLEAANGKEGVEKTTENLPDCVFMDLMMPEMDGKEAIAILRKQETTRTVPVIAVTADVMTETKDSLLSMGFNEVINKPFRIEQIHEVLLRFTKRKFVFEDELENDITIIQTNEPSIKEVAKNLLLLPDDLLIMLRDSIEIQDFDEIERIIKSISYDNSSISESYNKALKAAQAYDYKFFTTLFDEISKMSLNES